jgi:hypothetical protein
MRMKKFKRETIRLRNKSQQKKSIKVINKKDKQMLINWKRTFIQMKRKNNKNNNHCKKSNKKFNKISMIIKVTM